MKILAIYINLLFVVTFCSGNDSTNVFDTYGNNDVLENSTQESLFFAPEGVATSDKYIIVTNAAYKYVKGYSKGFITILSASSMKKLNRIDTQWKNPQFVTVKNNKVYVMCSGELQWNNKDGEVTVKNAGGIEIFDLSTIASTQTPIDSIEIPVNYDNKIAGAPGAFAISDDGDLMITGSATSSQLYLIDLNSRKVLRGPNNPIEVTKQDGKNNTISVFEYDKNKALVLSFNTDELYLFDLATKQLSLNGINIGANKELEGPFFAASYPVNNKAYIALSLASTITMIDFSETPYEIVPRKYKTGAVPNAIYSHKGFLYVVNSMENSVWRINTQNDAVTKPFITLPVGTNPWDIAFSKDEKMIYITGYLSNMLYAADLQSGKLISVKK